MTREARRLVLLGSTGSIGTQTLDVVDRLREAGHPIDLLALAAGSNLDLLCEQIDSYRPQAACIASESDARTLRTRYPDLEVVFGDDGLVRLAEIAGCDVVVNALVGSVGLAPTLAALRLGRLVALANKESLVIGGELVLRAIAEHGGRLFPLDSEHSAVFQCLEAGRQNIAKVILTASGGPFLRTKIERLEDVSPAQALSHPNWSMGSRITIDSATMVNKAFEVIEAHYLFDLPYERIDAVVHPESIVHALVEYDDGSMIAQLAPHDMRIPIQYALTYPERTSTDFPRLDLAGSRQLGFEPLDVERFPAFAVVLSAAHDGGSAPAAVNAADEILVSRFLAEEIPFPGIAAGLEAVLGTWRAEISDGSLTLAHLLDVDRWARELAASLSLR